MLMSWDPGIAALLLLLAMLLFFWHGAPFPPPPSPHANGVGSIEIIVE